MIQKLLKKKRGLYIFTIVLVFLPVLWSFSSEEVTNDIFKWNNTPWEDGWVQVIEDEEIPLGHPSEFESILSSDTLVLTNEIPELTSDQVLFFYSKDLEVRVYIKEELYYSFEMEEGFTFLKTPGNTWNKIEIPMEMSGETIRVEFTSQFANRYIGTITKLYLIQECETSTVLMEADGFRILMSFLILAMTISAYLDAIIWKRKQIKEYFVVLGTFCFSVTLWLFAMSGLWNLMWERPIVSYLISMLMASIIPITVYELVKVVYREEGKLPHTFGVVVWGNFFLQFLLQFVFGISLLDLLPLTYIVYTAGSIGVLYQVIRHILQYTKRRKYGRRNGKDNQVNFALLSMLIIFVGALVEIAVLCVLPERTELIGVASVTGVCIYLMVNQLALTRYEAHTDMENLLLEENYARLQEHVPMQQIKAHYFFNTLNTISALCKQDAAEADRAIKLFAAYMRGYMHLINEQKCIPFEKEMELVKSSLEIELLRFPASFSYELILEYQDFSIPPLSLQPIVENALLHGLRKTSRYGELRIISRKVQNAVEIRVLDNGAGFDTSILKDSESVGVKNLTRRLEVMANGRVHITSTLGAGTEVVIVIPEVK